MAAKTTDIASKKKKQTIALVVGGVLLAGLMAFQLPKLLGGAEESAAPVPVATGTPVASGTGSPSVVVAVPRTKSSAVLAGVVLTPASGVDPEQGDLASFSRFESKDPFDPQVSLEDQQPPGGAADTTAKNAAAAAAAAAGAAGGKTSGGATGATSVDGPAAVPTNATIMYNGKPQLVEAKSVFPKVDELFVVVSLKQKSAKVGVNGGSFTNGETLTLKLGKQVTLVNSATGARYVLKLVYTGAQPEEIKSFSGAEAADEDEEAADEAEQG